jgi:hypothetical protein
MKSDEEINAELRGLLRGNNSHETYLERKAFKTGGAVKCKKADGGEIEGGFVPEKADVIAKPSGLKKGGKIEIKHPGALSKKMGVPIKDNIPVDALKKEKHKAEKEGDKKLVRETTFALNSKKWNKK